MYTRRLMASALAAFALLGLGAVVVPAAAHADGPVTCTQWHQIVNKSNRQLADKQKFIRGLQARGDYRRAVEVDHDRDVLAAKLELFKRDHRVCTEPRRLTKRLRAVG